MLITQKLKIIALAGMLGCLITSEGSAKTCRYLTTCQYTQSTPIVVTQRSWSLNSGIQCDNQLTCPKLSKKTMTTEQYKELAEKALHDCKEKYNDPNIIGMMITELDAERADCL